MCQSFWVSAQILTLSSCDPPIWWKSLHIFHLQNKNHSQKWQDFNENCSCETVMTVYVVPDLVHNRRPKRSEHKSWPRTHCTLSGWVLSTPEQVPLLRHDPQEAGNQSCRQHLVGLGMTLQPCHSLPGVQLWNVPIFYTPKFQVFSPFKNSD